jgi:ubiquinone/menaquinone biosynthesis C-methylase UbiE
MSDAARMFSDGEAYERLMGRWSKRVGAQFLDWLAPASSLQWLDVGCGNGAFTEEIIARCAPATITAVDPSEGQLAYARTRPGAQLARFREADAQNLPFENQSFDIAAMALVISFIPDPARAVAEMARVVRPGGWVATYIWDFSVGGAPVDPLYRALKTIGIEPPMPQPHSRKVARLPALQETWAKAGLEAIEPRHIHIETVFSDFDDFWAANAAPVGPQGLLIAKMSPETREKFRTALRAELPAAPDGRITVPAVASAVKGRVPG